MQSSSSDSESDNFNGLNFFARSLLHKILYLQPTHVCVALDKTDHNGFRRDIDSSYKAHRPELADNIRHQLEQIDKVCDVLNVKCVDYDKYESDDVVYSYAKLHQRLNNELQASASISKENDINFDYETHVVSTDKDLLVLLNDPNVIIHRHLKADKAWSYRMTRMYRERVTPVSIDTFLIDPRYSDANLKVTVLPTPDDINSKKEKDGTENGEQEQEQEQQAEQGQQVQKQRTMIENYSFTHKSASFYQKNAFFTPRISDYTKLWHKTPVNDNNDNDNNCIDIEWGHSTNSNHFEHIDNGGDIYGKALAIRCPPYMEKIPLKKHNVRKTQFTIYLALIGDKTDGINGCPKIGVKRAAQLLEVYPQIVDFQSLMDNISNIKKNEHKLQKVIVESVTNKNNLKIIEHACKLIELQDVSRNLPGMDELKLNYDNLWKNDTYDELKKLNIRLNHDFLRLVNQHFL